jgi:ABC-type transporter Mla MlaB component
MPPRTRTLRATLRRPLHTDGHGARCVLQVCGELDLLTAGQVRARIQALAERHRKVTVDLTGATVYDQAALNALAEARVRAHRTGCRLEFAHAAAALAAGTAAPGKPRRLGRARAGRAQTQPTTIT